MKKSTWHLGPVIAAVLIGLVSAIWSGDLVRSAYENLAALALNKGLQDLPGSTKHMAVAERYLEQSQVWSQRDLQVHWTLFRIRLAQNDFAAADRLVKSAIRGTDRERVGMSLLWRTLLARGDITGATQVFRQAGFDPQVLVNLAQAARNRDDWEEIAFYCSLLLEEDPYNAQAHLGLGDVAAQQENWDEALLHYQLVLAVEPQNVQAHRSLANLLENAYGDRAGALEHLREAVLLSEGAYWDYYRLGILCQWLGRGDEAIHWLERAHQVSPDEEKPRVRLAMIASDEGRTQDAIEMLLEILETNPRSSVALVTLGSLYLELGQREEAAEVLQRAMALNPRGDWVDWAHSMMADIFRQRGEYGQAIEELQQAMVLNPEQPWHLVRLADVYVEMGQTDQAVALYRRALEMDVVRDYAGYIEEQLRKLD